MKKILSLVLALALLLGCASALAEGFTTDFDVPATGEKFVIYAWNDEFLGMLKTITSPRWAALWRMTAPSPSRTATCWSL